MGKKIGQALTALLLAAALLLSCMPVALAAAETVLQIGVVSDPHYFTKEQAGGYCEAFMKNETALPNLYLQAEGILESALAALAAHAKQNGMKYVLFPGDLTRDGELAGHKALAARLERFERETGLQVAVAPGNHDIHNSHASDYTSGEKKPAEMTTPAQFREIYKNLGYDLPNAAYYTPPAGREGGMLSYAADLGPGYRLVVLSTHKHDYRDNGLPAPGYYTGGFISEDLMRWAVEQCEQAVKDGKTVIGLGHHNLTPHFGLQERILLDFMLEDWLWARETLAQAGMHFYLSGHIHMGEAGLGVNDGGEALYDICTSSVAQYPCTFREVRFTSRGKNDITAQVKTLEVDCVLPVTANGVTYPRPFLKTSFGLSYHEKGARETLAKMVNVMLEGVLEDMRKAGGAGAYLKNSGMDLKPMLDDMLKGIPLVGGRNAVGLVNDILKQLDKNYVNRPERTLRLLNEFLYKLLDMPVSIYPSTQFLGSYGLGNKNKPGTFANLLDEGLVYTYSRVGGAENNKFINDALARLESGETADLLVKTLLDALLNDLLADELLPTLELNLAPVFASILLRLTLGALLDGVFRLILGGDTSFANLLDFGFDMLGRFDVMPYTGIQDAVDSLLEDYWTPSMSEGVGYQLAALMRNIVVDQNDVPDLDATLRYTGPRKVTATQEDFRLPSMVTQALPLPGDDYDRAIGWFTKYSVTGTDVRVWDSAGKEITKSLGIKKSSEPVERTFPGFDLGLFGMITVPVRLIRHRVEISGLEPLRAYTYQVGDAARGWWSPRGQIKMPLSGNQDTTFLSFSDMQSQTPGQYARSWGKISAKALALYPNALLAVSMGDNVDNAANLQQWAWLLDGGQSVLRQLPLMSATGNHEGSGEVMLDYLPIGSLPKQGVDTGLYYSFDAQNIHFIVLNTNDLDSDNKLATAQVNWLKKDMKASKADWNIVVMHKALYSNGSHISDADVAALRAQLTPLFAQLGVDVVIGGHDHVYLRTELQGVQYVIAGTSGVKYYNAKSPEITNELLPSAENIMIEAAGPVFAAYRAVGDTLTYTAYLMDEKTGAVKEIDSFKLQKNIDVRPILVPEWAGASVEIPATGEDWGAVTVPLALLLAAGFVLLMAQRKRIEEAAA